MKKLLLGLFVFCAVALGIWTYHVLMRGPSPHSPTLRVAVQKKAVPAAMVWFVNLDGSGKGGGSGVPEVDGYVGGETGSARGSGMDYRQSGSYKMVTSPNGKFFVLAHYRVEHSGVSTDYDIALPIYEKKPDAKQWAILDSHFAAFAYLDGTLTAY